MPKAGTTICQKKKTGTTKSKCRLSDPAMLVFFFDLKLLGAISSSSYYEL
jgi:hypothetical protein